MIAEILREYALGGDESLVLMASIQNNKIEHRYITIIKHTTARSRTYAATEYVTEANQDAVWRKRTMFAGRLAANITDPKAATILLAKEITIQKTNIE